jgi:hypothetical protein
MRASGSSLTSDRACLLGSERNDTYPGTKERCPIDRTRGMYENQAAVLDVAPPRFQKLIDISLKRLFVVPADRASRAFRDGGSAHGVPRQLPRASLCSNDVPVISIQVNSRELEGTGLCAWVTWPSGRETAKVEFHPTAHD